METNNTTHIPFEDEATVADKVVFCLARAYSSGQPPCVKTRDELIEEIRGNPDTIKGTLSKLCSNHVVNSPCRKCFKLVNLNQYKNCVSNDKGRMITRMLQEGGASFSLPVEVVHAILIEDVELPKHQKFGHTIQVNESPDNVSLIKGVRIFMASILRRLLKLIWPHSNNKTHATETNH